MPWATGDTRSDACPPSTISSKKAFGTFFGLLTPGVMMILGLRYENEKKLLK